MQKKKIGIETLTGVYNYGTRLQAYAMQEIFRSRGFDTEILQYENRHGFLSIIKYYLVDFLKYIFPRLMQERKVCKKIHAQYGELPQRSLFLPLKLRFYALDSFNDKYKYHRFIDENQLLRGSKEYDAVVCGSDQIWKPTGKNIRYWMLQFISEKVRRFSYAPSLGINEIPLEMKPLFSSFIQSLDNISVREVRGVELISELTDKPVHVVLDPTLLVGRKLWDRILKDKLALSGKDFCLCYLLGTNPKHRKVCSEVSKILGLNIYNFSHFKKYNDADEQLGGEHLYDITPPEFIGLISKAKFVVTDSFHCSVFAMMYHVPFVTLLRYDSIDKMNTNNRIYSLLAQFGLESRIFTEEVLLEDLITEKINYENVERVLTEKRQASNCFLDEALSGL